MNATLETFLQQLRDAEREAASVWGEFSLFGTFEQPEAFSVWDVVVSAPWLTTDREGILRIATYLSPRFSPGDIARIGRIVPLRGDDDFVRAMTRQFPTRQAVQEVSTGVYGGVAISRGFLITSNPHPAVMREYQPATGRA